MSEVRIFSGAQSRTTTAGLVVFLLSDWERQSCLQREIPRSSDAQCSPNGGTQFRTQFRTQFGPSPDPVSDPVRTWVTSESIEPAWQRNCTREGNQSKTHFGEGTTAANRELATELQLALSSSTPLGLTEPAQLALGKRLEQSTNRHCLAATRGARRARVATSNSRLCSLRQVQSEHRR